MIVKRGGCAGAGFAGSFSTTMVPRIEAFDRNRSVIPVMSLEATVSGIRPVNAGMLLPVAPRKSDADNCKPGIALRMKELLLHPCVVGGAGIDVPPRNPTLPPENVAPD